MKFFKYFTLALVSLYLLLFAFLYLEVEQQTDLGLVAVYATEPSEYYIPLTGRFHSWVAERKLYSLTSCPYDDFAPISPLMFIVGGMYNDGSSREVSEKLFRYFQSIGCDINRPIKDQAQLAGLRPLHMVMLSRESHLVRFLIEHGADKSLKISSPHYMAGYSTLDWLARICQKNSDKCNELERVLE